MSICKICLTGFMVMVFVQSFAQTSGNWVAVIRKLNKTNPALAKELENVKLVPAKSFMFQEFEGHDSLSFYAPHPASIPSFYMAAYEITNKQYREFVNYVQDSVLRHLFGFEKQYKDGTTHIDWKMKIDINRLSDESLAKMDADPINPEVSIFNNETHFFTRAYGVNQLVPRLLLFDYTEGKKHTAIPVMPDVDSWKKDYPYYYNEPLLISQFNYPAYDNYPVTGVNFYQAQAFCQWKTNQLRAALGENTDIEIRFDLPTVYQWEAAAVKGRLRDSSKSYTMDQADIDIARRGQNKPVRSNITNGIKYNCNFFFITDTNGYRIKEPGDDGFIFTSQVNAYAPNQYGIYNLNGNVAEWTTTNGDECFTFFKPGSITTATDSFLFKMKATKIVKGGSWKSSAFYIQPGVHQFYPPALQDGGTGFRYILTMQKKENR